MRSVNNIADVTNLIMLEYGQPMHSFDADKVADKTLIVRTARKGEQIKTLDEKTRDLDETDLLIADSKKPLGLAGVMGGKDSEVTDSTVTILLEAAIFDPISIRKTMQKHNLPSEASKRFQHGLTKTNLLQALSAAIKMYEELGGKLTALTLTGNLEDEVKNVQLTQEKVNSLIGIDIPQKDVESYLEKLGFHPRGGSTNSWEVTVPYWRLDINIEEDLIEEVARMYGYEKIPAKELTGEVPEKIDQSQFDLIYNLKKSLAETGLTEVQSYSFFSTKVLGALGFNDQNAKNAVKVANPISSETEYMRTFIWPNLVEVIEKNMRQGFEDIAIFEIGKVYQPVKDEAPKESYRLAIALMNGGDNPLEELLTITDSIKSLVKMKLEKGGMMKELEALFHPKRFVSIKPGGGAAEVHPRFLNKFGINKRVAILEISLE
jgi:phenylalanyl-tRNA synthetase beta chain